MSVCVCVCAVYRYAFIGVIERTGGLGLDRDELIPDLHTLKLHTGFPSGCPHGARLKKTQDRILEHSLPGRTASDPLPCPYQHTSTVLVLTLSQDISFLYTSLIYLRFSNYICFCYRQPLVDSHFTTEFKSTYRLTILEMWHWFNPVILCCGEATPPGGCTPRITFFNYKSRGLFYIKLLL